MIGYCSTCSYDPDADASWNVLPRPEPITPDPKTDAFALSLSRRFDDGRSSTAIKQILRTREIVAMMLYLCGCEDNGEPGYGDDAQFEAFFLRAQKYPHNGLFRSFIRLRLPRYNPPFRKSHGQRTISLMSPTTSNNTASTTTTSTTTTSTAAATTATSAASKSPTIIIYPIRHTAVLDLLSAPSRKQLILTTSRPRMCVADAIGLLIWLEANQPWYICEAFHWGSPRNPDIANPRGEQRVRALRSVVRWLVGLGPCEPVPVGMGKDMRLMWDRVKWLQGLNEKDVARYKEGQRGWEGWKWLVVLKEQATGIEETESGAQG